MYRILFTDIAKNDLQQAVNYIADELKNNQAAQKLLDNVEKAIISLKEMPERHRLIYDEYLSKEGFRFIVINNYLLFYIIRQESQTVVIERFLYAKRNWQDILSLEN